jgi:hypothetical protein
MHGLYGAVRRCPSVGSHSGRPWGNFFEGSKKGHFPAADLVGAFNGICAGGSAEALHLRLPEPSEIEQ